MGGWLGQWEDGGFGSGWLGDWRDGVTNDLREGCDYDCSRISCAIGVTFVVLLRYVPHDDA
jgi:hypothetical protein